MERYVCEKCGKEIFPDDNILVFKKWFKFYYFHKECYENSILTDPLTERQLRTRYRLRDIDKYIGPINSFEYSLLIVVVAFFNFMLILMSLQGKCYIATSAIGTFLIYILYVRALVWWKFEYKRKNKNDPFKK